MWESTFRGIVHDDCRFVEEQLSYIIYESRFMDIIEFKYYSFLPKKRNKSISKKEDMSDTYFSIYKPYIFR